MTISKDRVRPSPLPDKWNLTEIFLTGVALEIYLGLSTVLFYYAAHQTDFFENIFKVKNFNKNKLPRDDITRFYNEQEMASALYLQVSTISQALIFVTRSRSWSFLERPGLLLVGAFFIAQMIASVLTALPNWDFAGIRGIGWGWTGVIWIYNIAVYLLLDPIKIGVRYALSGRAWNLVVDNKMAFSRRNAFGGEARKATWAVEQRTLHGLHTVEPKFSEHNTFSDINHMAEEAKKRAEIGRLRELSTLKGKVESAAKLKGLNIDENYNQHYTL